MATNTQRPAQLAQKRPPFARLGAFVARHRWPVLISYVVASVIFGVFGVQVFANMKSEGFADPGGEAARAAAYVQGEFGVTEPAVVLVLQTPTDVDTDAAATSALLDTTIVRALLVPAFMRIAGNANWWAPAWLRKVHQKVGLQEG